ncbi:hypothetical protein [Cupriavidus sp. WS]|uniref:hypothetical protein n=1 Tax=Cupriavidus sp. WS TaxID=1312922 RepID=UPI001E61077E|nr:hypothetical protein [Cupriavidus sp. WS]
MSTTTLRGAARPATVLEGVAGFFSDFEIFADFLDFVVSALVAASAVGTASMETDSSIEAATAVKGTEPKNLENREESDRNMIHSARS